MKSIKPYTKYFKMYDEILTNKDLNATQKFLISIILDNKKSFISNKKLCDYLKINERNLKKEFKELTEKGLINKYIDENNKRIINTIFDRTKNFLKIPYKLLKNNNELTNQEKLMISIFYNQDTIYLKNETLKNYLNVNERQIQYTLKHLKNLNYIDIIIKKNKYREITKLFKFYDIEMK